MSAILRPISWFYHEFGVASLHATGRDAYLIITARSIRMVAYGTSSLILGMSRASFILLTLTVQKCQILIVYCSHFFLRAGLFRSPDWSLHDPNPPG